MKGNLSISSVAETNLGEETPALDFLGSDFYLEGVRFKVLEGADYTSRTTDKEGVALLKDRRFFETELQVLQGIGDVSRIFELGVWEGGSAALWALTKPLTRYVGIDCRSVDLPFPESLRRHPRWDAVRLHGHVSQDDRAALRRIVDEDFDGPLDLVVDDASHLYAQSMASFETLFPRLRPGGLYLIEDWAWAHRPQFQSPDAQWADQPALSNLVMRLVMLAASQFDLVTSITIRPEFVAITRGSGEIGDDFDMERLTLARGRKLALLL